MSDYTTELRFICEKSAGYNESADYNKVDEIVTAAAPHIFETFPIYNEALRLPLEKKILRHYYTREIGYETRGLFLLKLNNRMFEIMPKYNELYKSAALEYDILTDVDYKEVFDGSVTNTGTQDSTAHGTDTTTNTNNLTTKMRRSDTPQGSLADLENNNYMTEGRIDNNTGSVTTTASGDRGTTRTDNLTSTSGSTMRRTGKTGGKTYAEMITAFREAIINVDQLIIEELEDLFMGIW